jgi:hypothetical protein
MLVDRIRREAYLTVYSLLMCCVDSCCHVPFDPFFWVDSVDGQCAAIRGEDSVTSYSRRTAVSIRTFFFFSSFLSLVFEEVHIWLPDLV